VPAGEVPIAAIENHAVQDSIRRPALMTPTSWSSDRPGKPEPPSPAMASMIVAISAPGFMSQRRGGRPGELPAYVAAADEAAYGVGHGDGDGPQG
jgi:hypothetical protein